MRNHAFFSREIAFCGVVTALSVVLMALLSALGIATYAAPALAGALLTAVRRTFCRRDCLLIWAAVSLLSLLLVPDREAALLYLCLAGWYPAAQPLLERLPCPLAWVSKLAAFYAAIALMLWLAAKLLGIPMEETKLLTALLLALGTATFILYDRVLHRLELLYLRRLEPILFRGRRG